MVGSLEFEVHFVDDLYILKPAGLLDAQSGADLRQSIGSVLAEQSRDILIDCQGIDFMDSSGFGALISVLKRVREQGKQLFLCGLNSQVRIVLELTGTERVFTIFPSSEACVAFLSADQSDA
ncbi:STAS domain-containing protein [Synechococcus sp. CS-1332]|uniref:STAS domain-containing protein n=1 Tax=Synechococcus sp. CS-1332 TaxID=2847972 RepID=UPI00223BBEBC|nr:STAS domain-containing protein [Synechococcus sp. CS-1332]MCT0207944.1 STAS domain-containing protein [Synechococcus sp. CS-1332]